MSTSKFTGSQACVVSLDRPSWLLTKGGSPGACRNKDGIGQRKCEKKEKPKIRGKFVPGSVNRCSRLAASQHPTGAPSRRPVQSHFDPLSQLILDWDPKDTLCTWALRGWTVTLQPACPQSRWSRLAPGMYCVCWLCACWQRSGGGGFPALCPLGHCQLDPLPRAVDQPLSAATAGNYFYTRCV